MAGNPPTSGSQLHWPPPASGPMAPQNFGNPYPIQFRPAAPTPQGQPFMPPPGNQQYHSGQSQNLGMAPSPGQLPPFSQPVQNFFPRPNQPGHAVPSSYPQTSMPIPSSMAQPQPSVSSQGASFSLPYSYPPSSFGLPQNNVNVASQFQPSSQMSAPIGPAGGQPWLQSSQNTPVVATLQQAIPTAATTPAISGSSAAQQSDSDWQEFEAADGRRYYYHKITKQSSWEKPIELMTPLEISWQVWGILRLLFILTLKAVSVSRGRQQFAIFFYITCNVGIYVLWQLSLDAIVPLHNE